MLTELIRIHGSPYDQKSIICLGYKEKQSQQEYNVYSISHTKATYIVNFITSLRWNDGEKKVEGIRKRDGSNLSSSIPVHIQILLYFNLLRLVLLHGLQYKWRTFMMQMQAGAINLSLTLLSWALLTQKDVLCFLSLSRSLSHSPAHSGVLPHFPLLSRHCSIVLHSPPGHMKNESGPGDAVRK